MHSKKDETKKRSTKDEESAEEVAPRAGLDAAIEDASKTAVTAAEAKAGADPAPVVPIEYPGHTPELRALAEKEAEARQKAAEAKARGEA